MGIRHSKPCEALPIIKDLIESEDLIIFASSTCIKSFEALAILKQLSLKPFIVNIDHELNISSTKKALFRLAGSYEIPLIFIKKQCFGSLKDLKLGVGSGDFQKLLLSKNIKFTDSRFSEDLNLTDKL